MHADVTGVLTHMCTCMLMWQPVLFVGPMLIPMHGTWPSAGLLHTAKSCHTLAHNYDTPVLVPVATPCDHLRPCPLQVVLHLLSAEPLGETSTKEPPTLTITGIEQQQQQQQRLSSEGEGGKPQQQEQGKEGGQVLVSESWELPMSMLTKSHPSTMVQVKSQEGQKQGETGRGIVL